MQSCFMKFIAPIACAVLILFQLSGCIWGTVAVVGVAVVGANVDEYQESQKVRNATEALDEHLAHQKAVDKAMAGENSDTEMIEIDEVVDTYGSKIITD